MKSNLLFGSKRLQLLFDDDVEVDVLFSLQDGLPSHPLSNQAIIILDK